MQHPLRPRLRPFEVFPVKSNGDSAVAMRDPEGFTGTAVLPLPAALLASLMDGRRTLAEIQADFRAQVGPQVALAELEQFVRRLDEAYLLDNDRFGQLRRDVVAQYLDSPRRAAAHAGGAYSADPEALRSQLARLFAPPEGPGSPLFDAPRHTSAATLRGVLSPHIDLHRGGPAFAWAYKRLVEESAAETFVIFGTAHAPLSARFSITRKNFDTPLGTVETDQEFIDHLEANFTRLAVGAQQRLCGDELPHRHEHSVEFQALFLQYLLGDRRPPRIVPVLVGSFHDLLAQRAQPDAAAEIAAFVAAMRAAEAVCGRPVAYISGGDLAHVGQRFGDEWLLDPSRLSEQAENDHGLLKAACRGDTSAMVDHVANQNDRTRICGLSPTHIMMQVIRPCIGELLKYDQAVEPDGTSCVSFASVAFYSQHRDSQP